MIGHLVEREDPSTSPDSPLEAPRRVSPAEQNRASGIVAAHQLRSILERIERRKARKAEINAVLEDLYAEARAAGFSFEMIRAVLGRRLARKTQPTNRRT